MLHKFMEQLKVTSCKLLPLNCKEQTSLAPLGARPCSGSWDRDVNKTQKVSVLPELTFQRKETEFNKQKNTPMSNNEC